MRLVNISACFITGMVCAMAASAMDVPSPDLTVILDFKGPRSAQSLREMERESSSILKASGLNIGWKLRGEAMGQTFTDLVVMTFKGSCTFEPAPPIYDELG